MEQHECKRTRAVRASGRIEYVHRERKGRNITHHLFRHSLSYQHEFPPSSSLPLWYSPVRYPLYQTFDERSAWSELTLFEGNDAASVDTAVIADQKPSPAPNNGRVHENPVPKVEHHRRRPVLIGHPRNDAFRNIIGHMISRRGGDYLWPRTSTRSFYQYNPLAAGTPRAPHHA